ncbi:hypothetical protein ACFV3O_33815, partial [Streptomyces albidoflavus]
RARALAGGRPRAPRPPRPRQPAPLDRHPGPRLVNPTGSLGIAGVYAAKDLHPAAPAGHRDGSLRVPWAQLFDKGVRVGFGRTHDRRYTRLLRDLILDGRAHPERVVTHHGTLDDAPDFYATFDRREDGMVKAVLRP